MVYNNMININQKFFGLSLKTWIALILVILYLFLTNNLGKREEFTESVSKILSVYNFNTTWCGYSVRFQPIWDKFSKKMASLEGVKTFDVKCDDPDDKNVKELCQRYNVQGFPTVIFHKGNKILFFDEERTVEKLENVVQSMIE
tara:strand:- start:745 stop:1176 length:432 start_codon:yes stop_codon:yes gene_type:complete